MPDVKRAGLNDGQKEIVGAVLDVTLVTNELGWRGDKRACRDLTKRHIAYVDAWPTAAVVDHVHGQNLTRQAFSKRGKAVALRQHFRGKAPKARGFRHFGLHSACPAAERIAQVSKECNAQSAKPLAHNAKTAIAASSTDGGARLGNKDTPELRHIAGDKDDHPISNDISQSRDDSCCRTFCLDALDICAGHARAGQGRLHRGGTSRLQKNEGLLRGFRPQDRYGEWMFAERLLYLQPRNMHAGT
jgi:hypothetical protein